MTTRTDLPSPNAPNYDQRVRESLMTYLGRQGDPLDRGVILRDLLDSGIVSLQTGYSKSSIGSGSVPLVPGVAMDVSEPDLTPPPTPSNFTAAGGVAYVFIQVDAPAYTMGHGHLRTHIYGKTVKMGDPLPTFSNAVELGQFTGTTYAMPSEPATTWRLWVKFETVDGVLSTAPAGGTNGLAVTTAQDVGKLLEALDGQITESQLYGDLGSRIDQIDKGPNALTAQVTNLGGSYVVKIDNNGYVTGIGLASEPVDGTPVSSFGVRADRFYVASPTGPGIAPITPFVVQTVPVTINGVSVPAGVYINGAYIKGGTIDGAAFTNGTIENSKLINVSANKITSGSINIGEYIQSTNFVAGEKGWKIFGNGSAEFGAASIRGLLTASQIDTRGLSIKDSDGNVILSAGTPLAASKISGLGGLAFQNSVSVSANDVSGLGGLATQNSVFIGSTVKFPNGTKMNTGDFVNNLSKITASNISTFIADAAIGNAYIGNLSAEKITTGQMAADRIGAGSIQVGEHIQSSNFVAGSTGWRIDGSGNAEMNGLTVRSGQVTGALLKILDVPAFNSGRVFKINDGIPDMGVSTGVPYYYGGTGNPWFIVWGGTMPAPETAGHRIAGVVTVNASNLLGATNRDLAVLVLANVSITSGNAFTGDQIGYSLSSGPYNFTVTGSGASSNFYNSTTNLFILVGGFNSYDQVNTVSGLFWGVR